MITEKMRRTISEFIDYMEYDDIGDWVGLKKDAPQIAQDAYDEFVKEEEKAAKKGIKI